MVKMDNTSSINVNVGDLCTEPNDSCKLTLRDVWKVHNLRLNLISRVALGRKGLRASFMEQKMEAHS